MLNRKIPKSEFFHFYNRIITNPYLRPEDKHSKRLFFIPVTSGIYGGYIQIEDIKTLITSINAGKEILSVLLRCEVISQLNGQDVLDQILQYFLNMKDQDSPEFIDQSLIKEKAD